LLIIYHNRLNLLYVDPLDVKTIIKTVFDLAKFDFEISIYASMPLIEVVTQLLCFQQLVFIPSSLYQVTSPDEIGRLVGTNFFGLPRVNHVFSVYEILSIPFKHHSKFIQLDFIFQTNTLWPVHLTFFVTFSLRNSHIPHTLIGKPLINANNSIVVQNGTSSTIDADIFDIEKHLNDSSVPRLNYIDANMDDIMDVVNRVLPPMQPPYISTIRQSLLSPFSYVLPASLVIVLICIFIIYCMRKHNCKRPGDTGGRNTVILPQNPQQPSDELLNDFYKQMIEKNKKTMSVDYIEMYPCTIQGLDKAPLDRAPRVLPGTDKIYDGTV
ncbi:unnamed protein product, partial [Didymodactylos carnosus]